MLSTLGPIILFTMSQYLLYYHGQCEGYPNYFLITQLVMDFSKVFSSKFSALLTLLLAALGTFNVRSVPRIFSVILSGISCAVWSNVYLSDAQQRGYLDCSSFRNLYYPSAVYLVSGNQWESKYRLVDGLLTLSISVVLAIIGLFSCQKKEGTQAKCGYKIKSFVLILLTSISTFLFQIIYVVMVYIDIIVLSGYYEQPYLRLDTVMEITLMLNSIVKCLIYFCVSTKFKDTPMLVAVKSVTDAFAAQKAVPPIVSMAREDPRTKPTSTLAPIAQIALAAPTPIALMMQPDPNPMIMPQPQQLVSQGIPSNTQVMIPLGFQSTHGHMMIPNVIPNMVPNMMIPNVVPTRNDQENMQVSVVVLPMPYYHPTPNH